MQMVYYSHACCRCCKSSKLLDLKCKIGCVVKYFETPRDGSIKIVRLTFLVLKTSQRETPTATRRGKALGGERLNIY